MKYLKHRYDDSMVAAIDSSSGRQHVYLWVEHSGWDVIGCDNKHRVVVAAWDSITPLEALIITGEAPQVA